MKHNAPISILLLGCLISSCKKDETASAQMPPPLVEFVHPEKRNIIAWDEFTGRLEATEAVEVRSRVGGMLEKVHFRDGQNVEEGDLLFSIDAKPFEAALAAAEADLVQAEAARDLAKTNFERGEGLLARNAIAREEVDIRRGTYAEAEARVQAAAARVETARLDVGYTKVTAPISGKTSSHYVSEGNLISGGSAVSTLLTTIVSIDPIYCRIEGDEGMSLKYMRLIQEGKRQSAQKSPIPIELGLMDEEGFPREASLDFVNNTFDPDTATIRVRATVPNGDEFLTPGMFVKVRLPGRGEFEATLVPEVAIQTAQDLTFVLTVDESDTVRAVPVELGPAYGDDRVIESGLEPEARVIVTGLMSARPGTAVTARELGGEGAER